MAEVSYRMQIIPSLLAATVGISIFWLIVTFLIGRVYCSTVCPVGTLQDSANWLRRKLRTKKARDGEESRIIRPYSYMPRAKIRLYIVVIYAICLPLGLMWISALFEPWHIFEEAARLTNPELRRAPWLIFSGNALAGGLVGLLSLIAIWIWAFLHGRRFCSHICPIGTFLEAVAERSVCQIRINPDLCISCMACEDNCKSEAIKVSERLVDNGRCVRCFDCLKVCPNEAIRLQKGRNTPASPLLQKS
ncbi:MAG: 4Fe-4S binding protein [Muribaculaceae bacterium]|nr:4Fe-4S binding protein [Muribaculaceae bacterium]